jgi:hypothetical protein
MWWFGRLSQTNSVFRIGCHSNHSPIVQETRVQLFDMTNHVFVRHGCHKHHWNVRILHLVKQDLLELEELGPKEKPMHHIKMGFVDTHHSQNLSLDHTGQLLGPGFAIAHSLRQ